MSNNDSDFKIVAANLRESLSLELKQWIDPAKPEGIAKIAKACMALRNNNGGRLLIGFKDDSTPDVTNIPVNVHISFHVDIIQAIVSRYSAELFPIEVEFHEIDGQEYPSIVVQSGVKTPVAAKATLNGPDGKALLKDNAIYVRSLQSNNTVSSAEARRGDWDTLIRICFDNREADIGGFVRRHLSTLNLGNLAEFFPELANLGKKPSMQERVEAELKQGHDRFVAAAKQRGVTIPKLGYRESVILIEGEFPKQSATETFRSKLLISAPSHTGFRPWINLTNEVDRPYVLDHGWQAFIDDLDGSRSGWPHFDFWRMEPRGIFYHLRAISDDLSGDRGPTPGTQLDFLLQIARIAEVISMGLSFGRSLGCDETKTSIIFGFRWTGILGRRLTSWVEPRRSFYSTDTSKQDNITTTITVPLDTPPNGIAPHVENAVRELFALFGGTEFGSRVIEQIVLPTINRR